MRFVNTISKKFLKEERMHQTMAARMRTINEAILEIQEIDPQTAFTQTALRRMIKTGEIPSVKIGAKYLVNLDTLFDYLNNPAPIQSAQIFTANGIRPVKEKICN